MSDFEKLREKYNRRIAVKPKKFPVKQYRYPSRGLDRKMNPLYRTSSMSYGRTAPRTNEIPYKYYPKNN